MFDIQKFAEEVKSAENATENFSIPKELEGISEDIAKEVLEEYASRKSGESAETPAEPEIEEEGEYTGEGKIEDVKIDYARYKEMLDKQKDFENKAKDFEKQLQAYQEKFGDINAQPVPQQYQQPQYQQAVQEQKPPEPRYFTAEDARQINDEIIRQTMVATGLTQEDVDNLDYMDDNDPKLATWNACKKYAEFATFYNIMQAQRLAEQENLMREMMMKQSQAEFDNYVSQQQEAADFAELQKFAATEYYQKQDNLYRQLLSGADQRIANRQATPYDLRIMQDYMDKAAKELMSKKQTSVKPQKKPSPKPQFPRTDKVNGIPGSGGDVTNASLAEMMRTMDWDKIPPEYKKRLLGY